jgi:hypothetical protein
MPGRLTVHYTSQPARVLPVPDGARTVVGRDPTCDVVLDDERVSRRHAAIEAADDGTGIWTIADLSSKNGTLLDGAPIARAPLGERSWLSFGGLIARFERVAPGAETFAEERLRRFTTSLAAQRGLSPAAGLPALLDRLLVSALQLSGAERGFVLLGGADGELDVAARSGLSWAELAAPGFSGSVGAVERTLATGRPVASADAAADADLYERPSVVLGGIRALLCVPICALERTIGAVYADSREPGAAFTELDLAILAALAGQAGLAISLARLRDELDGLSARLAEDGSVEALLGGRLQAEIGTLWDRALHGVRPTPPERPPGGGLETWHGVLAAHAGARSEPCSEPRLEPRFEPYFDPTAEAAR